MNTYTVADEIHYQIKQVKKLSANLQDKNLVVHMNGVIAETELLLETYQHLNTELSNLTKKLASDDATFEISKQIGNILINAEEHLVFGR